MSETMNERQLTSVPVAATGMLIRRPVDDVFEAFVDPNITTRFWFSRGSARLVEGTRVRWDWEMYGVGADVHVKTIEENRRIVVDWGSSDEDLTTVEWIFTPRSDGTTFVSITNSGFKGTADEVCSQACDSTQGFSLTLAGLKAWLEHGIELNLVVDSAPDNLVEGWTARRDGHDG